MTPQQDLLFRFLLEHVGDRVQPSLDKMAEHMGVKHRASVHRLLHHLLEAGMVEKLPQAQRCWRAVPVNPLAVYRDEDLAEELRNRRLDRNGREGGQMKKTESKVPPVGESKPRRVGGAAIALAGGYKTPKPAPAPSIAPPEPPKRPRGADVILVAKIDPAKRIRAIIPIKADMRVVRRLAGSKHVGEHLVSSIDGLHVKVCCATIGEGKIWRVRGSLPIRGQAILYGSAGFGPSNFPGDKAWLERMIDFDPEGATMAINDKREEER